MNTNGIADAYASQIAANDKTRPAAKTSKTYGKQIGDPQLSEKAQKYYEKLKKKYANMDFILVSADQKEQAEANAAKYGSNKSLIVLIDEDKIEKMAEDESYRKKYEGILDKATGQFAQMKESLGSNADNVKAFGMKFDDYGNASFFAVVDKSLSAQRDRIQQKHDQKIADKKAAEKKAERKEKQDKVQEKFRNHDDLVTVEASSWDELLQKINETVVMGRSDMIQSQAETYVGQQFDYTI